MTMKFKSLLCAAAIAAIAIPASASADTNICDPGGGRENSKQDGIYYYSGGKTGTHRVGGRDFGFWTWYERSSRNNLKYCNPGSIRLRDSKARRFTAKWEQQKTWSEDIVGGMGWGSGRKWRDIGYNVGKLTGSSQRAIGALYGWGCSNSRNDAKAEEYYVVEMWAGGGQFVPWDENAGAPAKPSVERDGFRRDSQGRRVPKYKRISYRTNGGTYYVYKVRRNGAQYCGDGKPRSFDQYWAVRQGEASTGKNNVIDFGAHVNQWNKKGFQEGWVTRGYQVFGPEVFGNANAVNKGEMDATVWQN